MAKPNIKPKKSFSIKLKGDTWKIGLYTLSDFEKMYDDCIAVCEFDHKKKDLEIKFSGPKVSQDTVAHELFHALLSYHNFSRYTPAKMEERLCEIVGKKHKVFHRLTNLVYKKLTR